MKYRKKPVVIEAIQFTDETKDQVFNFVRCNRHSDFDRNGNPTLVIQTLEGDVTAFVGDFVIQGIAGEFYPCNPDIFRATYDKVEDSNAV